MDVLKHYGHTLRANGKLGKNVKYSRKSTSGESKRSEAEEKELCYANLLKTADNLLNAEKGRFFSASIYNGNTLKQIPGILQHGGQAHKRADGRNGAVCQMNQRA